MNRINYINKVEVTLGKNLQSVAYFKNKVSINAGEAVPFREIPISGLATLSVEENIENKTVLYTATLSFTADTDEPGIVPKMAYRLTTSDGRRLLMGDCGRPYVITTQTKEYPDSVSSPVKTTVKATWKATRTVAEIA
jgi:hypothetical protein